MGKTMNEALEELKQRRFEKVAETIVKYQNFKNEIAVSKMDSSLGKSTRLNYLTYGIRYLKTGYKSSIVPSSIYKCLDKCVEQHIQPLRPNIDDAKRIYKRDYTKKEIEPPISRLQYVQKPVTVKFTYGIKIGDKILLQKSELEAKGFMNGAKFFDNSIDIKLVSVNWDEV